MYEANEDKLHLRVLSSRCPKIYRGDRGREGEGDKVGGSVGGGKGGNNEEDEKELEEE